MAAKEPNPADEQARAKVLASDHADRVAAVARDFDALPAEWREHLAREAAEKLPPP